MNAISPPSLTFGSVCSGIEAASVAWKPLGWECAFMSEIVEAPRSVLTHHHGRTPLHGDFTTIQRGDYADIDVLVGGTPCQSFSVAGLRGGMADARGNLALEYLRLADRLRARWLVWENVPGVLSSNEGRDFGSFLGGLGQLGYGFAYRVLDAQFFGLAQRRKRVFVVGYLGDWRRAAAVLFEPASLRGHPAPRRKTGESVAPTISSRPTGGGGLGTDFDLDGGLISRCLTAHPARIDAESETFVVTHSLRGEGHDASEGGTGRGTPIIPCEPYTLAIRGRDGGHDLEWRQDGTANALLTPNGGRAGIGVGAIAYSIQAGALRENPDSGPDGVGVQEGIAYTVEAQAEVQAVAFTQNQRDELREMDIAGALAAEPGMKQQTYVRTRSAVRRLTPRECERLQGFPDDYTAVPRKGRNSTMADGPRYKCLGNSMAVPVMAWIGRRIAAEDAKN